MEAMTSSLPPPVGLENQAFAFANGRAFAAALANVAVTLTSREFY